MCYDLDDQMVWESENKKTTERRETQMKKNTNKVVAQVKSIVIEKPKAVLVKPTAMYTKDEVRAILKLAKGTDLVPSKYIGMGGHGKVAGSAVIAHLERVTKTKGRGRRSAVKIGRRYKSGTVTVVAR